MPKEKKTQTQEAEVRGDNRVYELGFHFVPTISEDDAAVQFSHLKSIIEKREGTFIAEEAPTLINLAYELTKTVKAVKGHYNNAYFGWVKFEVSPESIPEIEKDVKAFEPILRYLLISTVRESTLAPTTSKEGKKGKDKDSEGNDIAADAVATEEVVAPAETLASVDEAEIDKSIDQLVK